MKYITVMAVFLIIACGIGDDVRPAGRAVYEGARGEFANPAGGVIRIDLLDSVIDLETGRYPLVDCSDTTLRCLKNEALGFHVAVPRSCRGARPTGGEFVAGGFRFIQIALAEHGDARQGTYQSSLSERWAYRYGLERGIFEIHYDPGGRFSFGAGTGGRALRASERAPYTYRLPEDAAFLRCQE